VVAVLDVKKSGPGGEYSVWTHNGSRPTGRALLDLARELEQAGAGEIVVNSIDRDGTMEGYDLDLAKRVRDALGIPVTFLGGAGALAHLKALVDECGIVGAAAGSLFVFKGPYRAVLINYPNPGQKEGLVPAG
jgi:cyclase